MHFLIDADLPRAAVSLLQTLGHQATDVRDIGLGSADDRQIAEHARLHGLCLVTGDFGFADIRNYPPGEYAGIVVLEVGAKPTSQLIIELLESFARRDEILAKLPQRLAIVDSTKIRLRPAQ